jgi:hypothetical protein
MKEYENPVLDSPFRPFRSNYNNLIRLSDAICGKDSTMQKIEQQLRRNIRNNSCSSITVR